MSIYPAKNKRGQFTGSWTVEVMRDGKRTRGTAPDIKTADRMERLMRLGQPVPTDLTTPQAIKRMATIAARNEYRLGQLRVDAMPRYDGHKSRKQTLKNLDVMVKLLGPETAVKTIKHADLEKACQALKGRGLSPKTVNRHLSAISGILRWAYMDERIDKEPPKPWNKEGKGRSIVVPATDDRAMYGWLEKHTHNHQLLVYAVLMTTGIRVSELRNLQVGDIEPEWLHLRDTKNGDARDVPIKPSLSRPLRSLVERGDVPAYETIRSAFVAASEAVGLSIRVTPHVLRHTAGTRLNSAGVPTATIQKLMGHKDVRTTLGYVHADNSALQEAAKHLNGPDTPW